MWEIAKIILRHTKNNNTCLHHSTCILADKTPLRTKVYIIPSTRGGLEIEGEMVLITSRGLPGGPVVIPPS